MGLKTFTITVAELSKDCHLRNDEKYHSFLHYSSWNIFNSKSNKLIPLRDILNEDFNLFEFQEDEDYKGIPTGQTYLDEDGYIKEYQLVTQDNHSDRLKYKVLNENILISSLRLARSPALYFENEDLSKYVFSNGFYIFKVNKEWNIKFILHVLRSKKLKYILDNNIYRGIGISAYKKDDLLKIKIPIKSKQNQDKIVAQIIPIEKKIKKLKSQVKDPEEILNNIFAEEFKLDLKKIDIVYKKKYFSINNDVSFRNANLRSTSVYKSKNILSVIIIFTKSIFTNELILIFFNYLF